MKIYKNLAQGTKFRFDGWTPKGFRSTGWFEVHECKYDLANKIHIVEFRRNGEADPSRQVHEIIARRQITHIKNKSISIDPKFAGFVQSVKTDMSKGLESVTLMDSPEMRSMIKPCDLIFVISYDESRRMNEKLKKKYGIDK